MTINNNDNDNIINDNNEEEGERLKNMTQSEFWMYKYKNNSEFKNQISKYKKEIIKCSCGSLVSRGAMPTHKKSEKHKRLMNDEIIYKTFNERYKNDIEFREKVKNFKKEVIKCPCGCYVTRNNYATHKRSKHHIQEMHIIDARNENN